MKIVSFKPYKSRTPEPVRVVADQIESFTSVDYNGDHGTRIIMVSGRKVLVGEWPSDVEKKLNEIS